MRYAYAIIALLLSFMSSGYGQELNYDEALKLFEQNNNRLKSAKKDLIKQISETNNYSILNNPEVSYERSEINSGNEIEEVLSLEQKIDVLGQPFLKSSISSIEEEAYKKLYEQDLVGIYADFRNEFLKLLFQKKIMDTFNETHSIVEKAYKAAANRYEEGRVSGFELSRFRVALNGFRRDSDEAINHYYHLLSEFLGSLYTSDQIESLFKSGIKKNKIVGKFVTNGIDGELAQIQKTALHQRQDYLALLLFQKSHDKRVSVEELNRLPELSLRGGYKKVKNVGDGFMYGLALEIPVFNFNGNNIQIAKIENDKMSLNIENKRKEIMFECFNVFNKLSTLQKQLKSYSDTNDNLEILQTAVLLYTEGKISLVELIDAVEAHKNYRGMYYETLLEYNMTMNELNKVLGTTKAGF